MNKKNIKKLDIFLLALTILIFAFIIFFCIFNWHLVIDLLNVIINGKDVVKDYMAQFNFVGVIAISLLIIFCFFFPFFSSLPLQIICLFSYGYIKGSIIVSLSIAIASQLLFILQKNMKSFIFSKKQKEKQRKIEERIKNSKRNINAVMALLYVIPCIPFLIISSIACRSNMKWWKYTLFTFLGPIPEVFVTLFLGEKVTSASSPILSFIILVFMILLVVLSLIFKDKLIYFIFKPMESKQDE
ncbi:MAG: VTT domain-containing protein [Erysipelotrichaceae bacterium]|nr:VTT domain-containing protein [Erysipelotrichaceae bacterium]